MIKVDSTLPEKLNSVCFDILAKQPDIAYESMVTLLVDTLKTSLSVPGLSIHLRHA